MITKRLLHADPARERGRPWRHVLLVLVLLSSPGFALVRETASFSPVFVPGADGQLRTLTWTYEVNGGDALTVDSEDAGGEMTCRFSDMKVTIDPKAHTRAVQFSATIAGAAVGTASVKVTEALEDLQSRVLITSEKLRMRYDLTTSGITVAILIDLLTQFSPSAEWFLDRADLDQLGVGYEWRDGVRADTSGYVKLSAAGYGSQKTPVVASGYSPDRWTIVGTLEQLAVGAITYRNVVVVERETLVPNGSMDGSLATAVLTYWVVQGVGMVRGVGQYRFMGEPLVIELKSSPLMLKAEISGESTPPAGGTVTGTGLYTVGAKATLTAKPAPGYTFLRWEDGSQAATRKIAVSNVDVQVQATFQATATIAPATVDDPGAQALWVGVPLRLPLQVHSACLPKVIVSGLPSGLRYDAATRTLVGVPRAPTKVPAQVTVKAANVANATVPAVTTFPLTVEPLPAWAVGAFSGWVTDAAAGSPATARMTVTVPGYITGKFAASGKTYTFSAAAFSRRAPDGSLWLEGVKAKAGKNSVEVNLSVRPPASPGGAGAVPPALGVAEGWLAGAPPGDGGILLYRGVWKDAGMAEALKRYTGYYTAVLPGGSGYGSGYLAFTVDAAGNVRTAGKLADGTAVSCSGVLILDEAGQVWTTLYTAPAAYKGGCFAGLAEFWAPPASAAPVVVRPLGGSTCLWQSLNPQATADYEGFTRRIGLSGGWYSKMEDLRAHYGTGLVVGPLAPLPEITATVWITDYDEGGDGWKASPTKGTWSESLEVAPAPCSPAGLALHITPPSGVGTGFAAPLATPPVWDGDAEEYRYEGENASCLTIRFTRATGVFSGSFKIWYDYASAENWVTEQTTYAHVARTASFQGVLTPVRPTPGAGVEGAGFFLRPSKGRHWDEVRGRDIVFPFNWSYDFTILSGP